MLAAGALALPLVTVVALGSTTAGASSRTGTTGTGTVSCTKIKGTITFKPPLTNTGTATENTTVKITVSGCTGGTPKPKKGSVKEDISTATSTNSCLSLNNSSPETLNVKWSPASIAGTTTSFSGYMAGSNMAGDEGFVLPNSGGTGTATGSYPTGSATASAYSNETESQITAACGTTAGLKKLKVTSGSATL